MVLPVRHPRFYFADGDIIFSAPTQPTAPSQLFRVHRHSLTRISPVFNDMFGVRSALDETYDGVAVVTIQDSADDFASFLNIVYDPA